MFYLSFENQLQLLLLLVLSSYIFATGLSISLKDPSLKAMGLSFVIPMILGVYSFLSGPHNINAASLYLDLAWFLLILVLTLISLIQHAAESLKFLYPVLFFLPVAAILMQPMLLGLDCSYYMRIFVIGLAAIELLMTLFGLFGRNKSRLMLTSGILLMAVGFILILSDYPHLLMVLVPPAAGLLLCAVYFYKNTYGRLKAEFSRTSEELERLNRSIHAEVMRRVRGIEQAGRSLAEVVDTDSLTGLNQKSAILNTMENMIENTPRARFSLILIDIDHLQDINEKHGKQAGDQCLKSLSRLIQASFRKDDVPGRYGGDEFAILLPGTTAARAALVADRFRQTVQAKTSPAITVSAGVAAYPDDASHVEALIAAADKALQASKENGRNRVTCCHQLANRS